MDGARQLISTNYGLRVLDHRLAEDPDLLAKDPLLAELAHLRQICARPFADDPRDRELIAAGLAQTVPAALEHDAIALRYRRNPLENIRRIVFEYTNVCQLSCSHCRNGHLPPAAAKTADLPALREVVDAAVAMGVRQFHFIGGEVTLYGRGWLELVEHIRSYPGTSAGVITSGWFLTETEFKAANAHYANDHAYLQTLAARGLTHVIFSVDGPEALHDQWRGFPGLYRRILGGFDKVRAAGMHPRVSIVMSEQNRRDGRAFVAWLREMAEGCFPEFADELSTEAKIQLLLDDDHGYASNFIDVGNAVGLAKGELPIREVPNSYLRCKNFFRPFPSLRIQANGDISLCPLIDSGTGYGNVREQGFIALLNGLQDQFVFRLHAERKIEDYRPYLDTELFGETITHVCSLRTVLTMLAKAMHERDIDPSDTAALRALNLEVARKAGFAPASGLVALGHRRPGS